MAEKIKMITCNVRGISDSLKRRQIFRYLHEKKVNISFLQETHGTNSCERRWKSEWGGRILYDNGTSDSRGVAIIFDRSLPEQLRLLSYLYSYCSMNSSKTIQSPRVNWCIN